MTRLQLDCAIKKFLQIVDGNDFIESKEKGLELGLKSFLIEEGFEVKNQFSIKYEDGSEEIADLAVNLGNELALIELKYNNTPEEYQNDCDKAQRYYNLFEDVSMSAVLFLSNIKHKDFFPSLWEVTPSNEEYKFYYGGIAKSLGYSNKMPLTSKLLPYWNEE